MAKDWEQAYQDEDTPWDKGYPAPPLDAFLEKHAIEGKVLVPGCGAGHDVRRLSAQGAEVLGIDLAPSAIRRAEAVTPVGSERYQQMDFFALPEIHLGAYDWVVEHTCLCAIDPEARTAYVNSLKAALHERGYFLAVFFRQVEDYQIGDGPPHPISAEEIELLFDADDWVVLERFTPQKHYPGRPYGAEEVVWFQKR